MVGKKQATQELLAAGTEKGPHPLRLKRRNGAGEAMLGMVSDGRGCEEMQRIWSSLEDSCF